MPHQQTEVFRFGNTAVDDWEGKVNAWPLDEGLIDYVDMSRYGDDAPDNPYASANVNAHPLLRIGGRTLWSRWPIFWWSLGLPAGVSSCPSLFLCLVHLLSTSLSLWVFLFLCLPVRVYYSKSLFFSPVACSLSLCLSLSVFLLFLSCLSFCDSPVSLR